MSRQPTAKLNARKRKPPAADPFAIISSPGSGMSEEIEDSPKVNKMAKAKRLRKKQTVPDEDMDGTELELDKSFKSRGGGYQKKLAAKKRQLQEMSPVSLKKSIQKLDDFLSSQQTARKKLNDEFSEKFENVFTHWDNDMKSTKEQINKLQTVFVQQQKFLQKINSIQNERLKIFRDLMDQFAKASENLEDQQKDGKLKFHKELNDEVAELQKKLLAENQKKFSGMKKSLSKFF